jgi:hypothetical protein
MTIRDRERRNADKSRLMTRHDAQSASIQTRRRSTRGVRMYDAIQGQLRARSSRSPGPRRSRQSPLQGKLALLLHVLPPPKGDKSNKPNWPFRVGVSGSTQLKLVKCRLLAVMSQLFKDGGGGEEYIFDKNDLGVVFNIDLT